MKIAISQPTYLPWLGYFDLIDQVDTFVFLDTVQFEKRSWQQRNRIKTREGLSLLTVPVAVKGRFDQKITDAEIKSSHFVRKHLRSLELNYHRCPYFREFFPELAQILHTHSRSARLADLNIQLIRWMCDKLGVTTLMLRSSEVNHEGRRSELLINLCRTLNADCYVSSPGSAKYLLHDISRFSAAGIDVIFQQYDHPQYRQRFSPFMSHTSIIDLLFNEGCQSLEILRTGRKPALAPSNLLSHESDWVAG